MLISHFTPDMCCAQFWLTVRVKVVDTAAGVRYGAVFRKTKGLLEELDM